MAACTKAEIPVGLDFRANDTLLTRVAAKNFSQRCETSFAATYENGEGGISNYPSTQTLR